MFYYRSTPIETLHTILLGPYKYLLKVTIPKFSRVQKEEILARIRAFNFSGFRVKLVGNVIQYHQSFVGRDYKAWAQMAPFVIFPYLNEDKCCVVGIIYGRCIMVHTHACIDIITTCMISCT